jgi:hypothetical protein
MVYNGNIKVSVIDIMKNRHLILYHDHVSYQFVLYLILILLFLRIV